jgi:peptidoglycan/LPS O-acetylase OafA/YrhL
MYLLHFPIVIFIFSFFYKVEKQELTYFNFILFLIIIGGIVIISYFFWFLFERKTADFKNRLKGMLSKLNL